MKKYTKLAVVSVLSGTLAACSSSDSEPLATGTDASVPINDPTTVVIDDDDDSTGSDAGATTNGLITAPDDNAGTTDIASADGTGSTDASSDGTGTTDASADDSGSTGASSDGTGTTDASAGDSGSTDASSDGTGTTDASADDSGSTDASSDGTGTTDASTDGTGTTGASADDSGSTDASSDGTGTTDASADDSGSTDALSDGTGTTTGDTSAGTTDSADAGATDEGTTDDGATDGDTGTNQTPSGRSALGNPPTLVDPFADAIPSPDSSDPFGFDLEIDSEVPVAGGAPTTPKNLRVDLISNDWAEINWAPSNDDVAVEEYRLYRSDGHIYTIREDQVGAAVEIAKIWSTTSFIDCNYTRFSDKVHFCNTNGPQPGDTFSYQITAVDGDGQESPLSNTITITYHESSNAPVPKVDDFYKNPDDTFVQDHDLSDTAFFLDKFSMVFEDNFDGPVLDADKWQTSLTWGDNTFINGEQQFFVNTQGETEIDYDPFKFEDGDLVIEAIKTPDDVVDLLPEGCEEEDPTGLERCQFLSGALSSHDKFGITYGYVEGRMKVGGTAGMLSSFYMYHRYTGTEKNLHGPEIDIIEYLGENPFGDEDAFQTYHFRDVTDGSIRSAPTMSYQNPTGELYADDYHTFGMLWEPQLVIWYIDGKEIKRLSGVQVGRQQMNIVTYLVAGSAWAPTPDEDDSIYPLQYKIDYIRAYQRPEYSTNGLYPSE